MKLVDIEWLSDPKGAAPLARMTVEWRRFLGLGKRVSTQYQGSCTVWHHWPSGARAGTGTEMALCDLWKGAQFKLGAGA